MPPLVTSQMGNSTTECFSTDIPYKQNTCFWNFQLVHRALIRALAIEILASVQRSGNFLSDLDNIQAIAFLERLCLTSRLYPNNSLRKNIASFVIFQFNSVITDSLLYGQAYHPLTMRQAGPECEIKI